MRQILVIRCQLASTSGVELLPICPLPDETDQSERVTSRLFMLVIWEGSQLVVNDRLTRRSLTATLGWWGQRFLREVEAIRHTVGSLISCIQWLQPKRNF
jgi:hypothetical protein